VWSYEIGAKDSLLDGHLQVDTSVFHIDWKNIQQPVLIPVAALNILPISERLRATASISR